MVFFIIQTIFAVMAYILCIDTAIDVCSVSLFNNADLLASRTSNEKNVHAQKVTLFIEQVVAEAALTMADINAIALSAGPGSYTGMRIGTSVAKGLCYALEIPLIAIDTLQIMTAGALDEVNNDDTLLMPMIDARRNEVYTAVYNTELEEIKTVSPLVIDNNEDLLAFTKEDTKSVIYFGNGADKYKEIININNYKIINYFYKSSLSMGRLAFNKYQHNMFENIAYFEPRYLKIFQQVLN